MWNSNQFLKASTMQQLPEPGSTASLSNTVCISDPDGHWPAVQDQSVKDLAEYGEIARLDASLAVIARCILVTYFDVRCAQRLMLSGLGRCEPFPPAAHDIRTVRVHLSAFAEKVDHVQGGFNQFGEVAHISASHGYAIVEFYDIRAAQMLLAASQGTAIPWTPEQANPASALLAQLGAGSWPQQLPAAVPQGGLSPLQSSVPTPSEEGTVDTSESQTQAETEKGKSGNRPMRTKVSMKEFSKYDIDPDRIQRGLDSRTTVMVRNLVGNNARKEFLMFLEKCGLADRFTFFYMPCKEHRNVPAGFAFINFVAPADVHKILVMVKSGFWRECKGDAQAKAPAISYARFQGHEELVTHFSSSAVLHEQDPEKRPIFRPDAAVKAAKEKQRAESAQKDESMLASNAGAQVQALAALMRGLPPGLDGLTNPGLPGTEAANLIGSQFNELASLLGRAKEASEAGQTLLASPPAYVKPSLGALDSETLQLLSAATSKLDSNCFAPIQMGA